MINKSRINTGLLYKETFINVTIFIDRAEPAKLPKVPETLLKRRRRAQEIREARAKAAKAARKVPVLNGLPFKEGLLCSVNRFVRFSAKRFLREQKDM